MSDFFSGLTLDDLIKTGADIYSNKLQQDIAKQQSDQAKAALLIEQNRIAQIQAQADLEEAKAAGKTNIVKAYILPITIVGILGIAGIASYFIFKKKATA